MEKIEDLYNLMVQSKLTKNSFSAFKSEFESSADYRKQIFNTIQSQKGITKLKAFSGANIATFENRYISKLNTKEPIIKPDFLGNKAYESPTTVKKEENKGSWGKPTVFVNTGKEQNPVRGAFAVTDPIKHITVEDLTKVAGEKPTWSDELFNSEENVYNNLKDHYKKQNVSFEQVSVGFDEILVKNESGDTEVFKLPSTWNGSLFSDGDWNDFHKNITNFIQSGHENIDPVLNEQLKNAKVSMYNFFRSESFMKEAIPDWDGNWMAMMPGGDESGRGKEEYKDLKNLLLEQFGSSGFFGTTFGFDSEYSALSEVDIEYALDKAIELKAEQQQRELLKIKLLEKQKNTGGRETEIINAGDISEMDKMDKTGPEGKRIVMAHKKLIDLNSVSDDQKNTPQHIANVKAAKTEWEAARKGFSWWQGKRWTKGIYVMDDNGNLVDNDLVGENASQITVTKEEYDDIYQGFVNKTNGKYEGLQILSGKNHVDLYDYRKRGKKRYKYVLNDEDAYIALALDGIKPIGSNKNGYIYDIDIATLANHYNIIVKGDGHDNWISYLTIHGDKKKDPSGVTVDQLRANYKSKNFQSPEGHSGLEEHSSKQTFGWLETNVFDEDEFADIDMSKEFKRMLVEYKNEGDKLIKDRSVLTAMHLQGIDPGSNTLSFEVDFNSEKPGKTTFSLDVVPRAIELLHEGFGDALGFDPDAQTDLNLISKRRANDILETIATESPENFQLNDEQKERIKRTGAYQVFEGVTNFVPAVAEFALLDVAIKKIGIITGLPKLFENISRTYQMGARNNAVTAQAIAKQINYTGSLRGSGFTSAINQWNLNARIAGSTDDIIKANKGSFFSTGVAMNHGYHILVEELKMKAAFEDDYKVGMGAGFYVAGNMLPRFTFGTRDNLLPGAAAFLNGTMKLGRPGVAGATGTAFAGRLEGFIEDVRGGTSYEKYLVENYGDLGEQAQSSLVDFFTFFLVARGKGVSRYNFKKASTLGKLETESHQIMRDMQKEKENNTGLYKENKQAWEKKYQKYSDLNGKVTSVLNELDYNASWENIDTRKKIVERSARNATNVFQKMGLKDVKIEIHDNNNKFQNKDALAEITADGKTIFLDLQNITSESLPHEIAHMTLRALFKGNPTASRAFANQIRDAFTNRKLGTFEVKDVVDGKLVGTGKTKEMNLEEYIQNEYKNQKKYEEIKDEEFIAYAVELLSGGKHYSALVNNGVFSNLQQSINRFSNQYRGEDVFKTTDSKQQLINFLANFGTSIKKGALTINQIEMFEKFGLKLVEGGELDITQLYKEPISKDSRTESEIQTSSATKGVEDRKIIEEIYTTKIANLTGGDKRTAIEDFLIGKSAKKGTEAYEFEIKRQNPNANDAKIKELIESGPSRLKTEAHFNNIVRSSIKTMYPKLTFAEREALINEINFDPFKASGKGRGIVDIVMDYKAGKSKDLASWVMGNLFGSPETGGFSRIHEIKGRPGNLNLEIKGLFRRSITEEEGAGVTEAELGSTTQEQQRSVEVGTPYKGKKIKLAEELKLQEQEVVAIKRVAGNFIQQAKLKDLTYNNIGNEILPIARPVVERLLSRDAVFYKKLKDNGLKDPYVQKVIKENRKQLFDLAEPLFNSIPEQMSQMTAEVTGAMKTFGNLYTPTGRRVQWSEMPVWMGLSAKKKASGPFVFEKKKFFNETELKRAFLDFIYLNPETGKPLRTEQVNTRIEKLIDFTTKSLGVQTAKDLVDTPGYREMILEKEGAGAAIGRDKIMKLDQQNVIDKLVSQVRDALPESLATFGVKEKIVASYKDLMRNSDLESPEEILDLLQLMYSTQLKDINLNALVGKIEYKRIFSVEDIFEDFVEATSESFEINPALEFFPGGVTGKTSYSLNDAIRVIARTKGIDPGTLDLRTAEQKFKSTKIALAFYNEYLPLLAKKLGIEVIDLSAFAKTIGNGSARPNFGSYEYKAGDENLESIKVESFEQIPLEYRRPMGKYGGYRNQLLNAEVSKNFIEQYKEGTKSSDATLIEHLKDVRMIDNSEFLKKWDKFVVKVEKEGLEGEALESAIKEFGDKELSASGEKGGYKKTLTANRKLLEHVSVSMNEVYSDLVKQGKEAFAIEMHHLLIQMQTNIMKGFFRGLATHRSGTLEAGVGMKYNSKGLLIKPSKYYRSEHFVQSSAFMGNDFINTMKNHDNNNEFTEIHRKLSSLYGQAGISKRHQIIVDENGNTTNVLEKYGSRGLGEFNILNDLRALEKTVDFASGKNFYQILMEPILSYKGWQKLIKEFGLDMNVSEYKAAVSSVKKAVEKSKIKITSSATKGFGRKLKGMSTWDFDGTLATTKSGVRATIPNPSGEPKPNRKVIFMAGGAGSGKGNVIKKLNLEQQGFKVVNSDISLEWLKKNNGLPENMNDFTPEQRSLLGSLQHQARGIAKNKMMKYKGSADGVVVDGTGGSIKAMEKLVKEFKDNGYDVSMVFVETSLEAALTRNATRAERSLLDVIVRKNHEAVQGNKEGFKEMFGERFMEVNTDNIKQEDAMPTELISKMKDFVSGYEKVRLDAEQFANEGKSILDAGGKFDFTEFNVVTEGAQGPMFQTALNRAKKFGTKDQFILTARPQEAALPIYEFLKSQGLEIPIENITGLGNSTGEAKALWMVKKFAEGYNDMYFADDVMQNTSAVKSALDKLQVKSKVVLAKGTQKQQLNNIKNPDKLDSPGVYESLASKGFRAEYEKTISKLRPDLVKEGSVSRMVDEMFDFIDTLKVPENKKRKYEQITTKWLATGNIRIKEDAFRIKKAMELADRYKEDVFSYRNPNEIIEKYAGKVKEKPTVPKSTKEFTLLNDAPLKDYGVEEVMITDTRAGQAQARKIVNRHWGNESNPWCLTQVKDGKLTEDAWTMWTSYDKGPKHLVFYNGKLLAFKASNAYWDRMNHRTEGVMINVKEGRVTHRTELTRESTTKPSGVEVKGAIEPVIRETRTVSEDGNTVKTEIFENSKDGYTEGTVLIENRTKGVRTKETRFDSDGTKVSVQEFDKAGKPTTSYEFSPGGKIKSVNGHLQKQAINEAGLDVNAREDVVINLADNLVKKVGDILEKNYTEKDAETGVVTDYFYGRISLDGKVIEIGFESKSNLDIADVMKTVDGKTRIDINKVLEVDPTLKGLPKDFKPSETGMQNIESVKRVLDQLDAKSEVQQSLAQKNLNKSFNDIIEETTKVESQKVFSDAQAKIRGAKKRYDSIIPASVQDLGGLLYNFLGKGKVGEKQMEFFKENLIDPFSKGINELNQSRQATSNDYNNLLKYFPDVKSKLNKSIEGSDFTYDQAIRVYLWNKAGFEVPGLSKRDLKELTDVVDNNTDLLDFASKVSIISKKEAGYSKPSEHWLVENLTSELLSGEAVSQSRSEFLAEWKQNSSEIFSKENLNKIQATYGNKFREALEDILYRMENGTNRPTGSSRLTNNFMNWINNSTGAIMFFNMRSALLQTLSTTNYINWAENNPLKAATAFANQKQYWKDFSELFNSDFLKQRRSGNQRSINEAELSAAVANSDSKPKAALAWLLQKGFLPTQIADSFAIASGGATFYRNRINKYIKEGMSPEQAREKAFLDFQEITEATQQSARPDMISQQQASPLGRLILSFQNTPMQYARIMNKAARDIASGRGDQKSNISKIVYYGALQSIIFGAMQSAIFASLGDDEEEEFDKKKERIMYSMVDGWLAGLGVTGKAVGTVEKSIREYLKQEDRGFNADHAQTIIQLLGFSPPVGSKVRKIHGSIQTEQFNKGVSEKRGFTLDNPTWSTYGNVVEGFTNVPMGRLANKMLNIDNALDSQNEWWERAALLLGWNTWDLGIKDPDIEAARKEVKQDKKDQKPVKKKYSEMTFEEIEAERERRKKAKELKLQSQ
jgi:hypothetical protein